MRLVSRRTTRGVWGLLVVAALATSIDGALWLRDQRRNAQQYQGESAKPEPEYPDHEQCRE